MIINLILVISISQQIIKIIVIIVLLKKLSDVVVKNRDFNKQNTKVSSLDNKIPDASTLNQTNQYSKDKHNFEKIWRS